MPTPWVSVNIGSGPCAEDFKRTCGRYYSDTLNQPKTSQYIAAILSLGGTIEDYFRGIKKIHKGNAVRDMNKAERLGYFCSPFHVNTHLADIVTINHSKELRQGKPMSPSYRRTLKEMGGGLPGGGLSTWWGGYDQEPANDYRKMFGVFKYQKDYYQESLLTNQRLYGYVTFRRMGELGMYSQILGHGDYLSDGIMYLLHRYIINSMWGRVSHILYASHKSGTSGLQMWKKRMGFKPRMLHCKQE